MEKLKDYLGWLTEEVEGSTQRYMEAEDFIVELLNTPWYKRIFIGPKIIDFLKSRYEKYYNDLN